MAFTGTGQHNLEKVLSFRALEEVRSAIVIADAADPDHRIVYVNPAFETLTGFGPDDTLERNCRFLQGEDREQASRDAIRNALSARQPVRAVLRNYRKDGRLFYNELFIDPVSDPDDEVIGFVACQNAVAEPDAALLHERALERSKRLTHREYEVFQLLVSGYPSKLIARELDISLRTADKHRRRVLRKFEVAGLTLLVRYAIALGVPLREPPVSTPLDEE